MCGPQWIGFCAEMFKWFVVQLGAGETRAQENSVPESVAGKGRALNPPLPSPAGCGPEEAPCSAVPDRQARPGSRAISGEERSAPAEKAGPAGRRASGAAGRGVRARPGAPPPLPSARVPAAALGARGWGRSQGTLPGGPPPRCCPIQSASQGRLQPGFNFTHRSKRPLGRGGLGGGGGISLTARERGPGEPGGPCSAPRAGFQVSIRECSTRSTSLVPAFSSLCILPPFLLVERTRQVSPGNAALTYSQHNLCRRGASVCGGL